MAEIEKWRISDEDFQNVKKALREMGYLPNAKLVHEMVNKCEQEMSLIRISNIDELSFEYKLREEDIRKAKRYAFQRRMAIMLGTIAGLSLSEIPIEEIEKDLPF